MIIYDPNRFLCPDSTSLRYILPWITASVHGPPMSVIMLNPLTAYYGLSMKCLGLYYVPFIYLYFFFVYVFCTVTPMKLSMVIKQILAVIALWIWRDCHQAWSQYNQLFIRSSKPQEITGKIWRRCLFLPNLTQEKTYSETTEMFPVLFCFQTLILCDCTEASVYNVSFVCIIQINPRVCGFSLRQVNHEKRVN